MKKDAPSRTANETEPNRALAKLGSAQLRDNIYGIRLGSNSDAFE